MSMQKLTFRSAKKVLLGSALWGWATPREEVFAILDTFATAGGGVVDTAANYPINGIPADFGRAAALLSEWLRVHRPENVRVLYKVGSLNNEVSATTALTASDIILSSEVARGKFADWLGGIAVHWDNRDDPEAIESSLGVISALAAQGFDVGFSGVKRPDLYLQLAPDLASRWLIQVKENVSTQSARKSYQDYFPSAQFLAYGINMGGVKGRQSTKTSSLALRGLEVPTLVNRLLQFITAPPADLADPPANLNELAMMLSWANPSLAGVILGPRTAVQLADSLRYWERLSARKDVGEVIRLTAKLKDFD